MLRFVCVSDTHGREKRIPDLSGMQGDVLLHAGDFSMTGMDCILPYVASKS
jgi:predicted phosphodiesterase